MSEGTRRSPGRYRGGPDDDDIFGQPGRDELLGERGADCLHGGGGRDVMRGVGNTDTFIAREGTRDDVFGGPDIDRGRFDAIDHVASVDTRTFQGNCPTESG